jgi:hypothetical protein
MQTTDQRRIATYYQCIQVAMHNVNEALLCISEERETADCMNLAMARRRLKQALNGMKQTTGGK